MIIDASKVLYTYAMCKTPDKARGTWFLIESTEKGSIDNQFNSKFREIKSWNNEKIFGANSSIFV